VRQRLVVLISGSGTNLLSLLESLPETQIPAHVVAVGSDVPAPGLQHAADRGIATFVVPLKDYSSRDEWGVALGDALASYTPDLIVLSGFMKLLPASLVRRFSPRIINTHPAYLPDFPGAHAVRDALEAGVEQTGASVIVVDEGVDTGEILAKRRVPIEPGDGESTLHDRIKVVERVLLLEVLDTLCHQKGT
jgi:phosphoribosylglycinamide formyltransferase-1